MPVHIGHKSILRRDLIYDSKQAYDFPLVPGMRKKIDFHVVTGFNDFYHDMSQ